MSWSFAKVNNRLAEIYFEKEKGRIKVLGYCYVKKEEYKSKKEQKWIESDSSKFQSIYKDGIFRAVNKPDFLL